MYCAKLVLDMGQFSLSFEPKEVTASSTTLDVFFNFRVPLFRKFRSQMTHWSGAVGPTIYVYGNGSRLLASARSFAKYSTTPSQ